MLCTGGLKCGKILFRGRRDNDEWVYGDLLQIPKKKWYSIMPQTPVSHNVKVIYETIGQCTGRNGYDKNGELCYIYEGDICSVRLEHGSYICKVEYREGGFALTTVDNKNFIWLGEMDDIVEELILLGNIYDNPELLECT